MLMVRANGLWRHHAVWDTFDHKQFRRLGALPKAGVWVRLEEPVERLGLLGNGKLRAVLYRLGYAEDALGKGPVELHKTGARLPIILPRLRRNAVAEPIYLLRVRKVLANDGIVPEDQFDALFEIRKGDQLVWTAPMTGQQVRVTVAANESDGTVIIRQNGTLADCPVGQLQKVGLVGAEDATDQE